MTRRPDIRAVCFDLGGVLVRIARSWTEGCCLAGIEPRHDESQLVSLHDRWHRLVALHQTGRMDGTAYFARVSELVDGLYSPHEVQRIHKSWCIEQYRDVELLINELHQLNVLTAALSNTNHEHWSFIRSLPAIESLQHHVLSHEIGHIKPDEAAYRCVEQVLGVSGERIMFFDDLPENIEVAQRMGWQCALIDHAGDTAAQMCEALQVCGLGFDRVASNLKACRSA